MRLRDLPLLPTIVVVAAAGIMVMLGFWQLDRRGEKEAQIARYEAADRTDTVAISGEDPLEDYLFRSVRIACAAPSNWQAVAGRSANGQAGYEHRYRCAAATDPTGDGGEGARLLAAIGWSRGPADPAWSGGSVTGVLAPAGDDYKVVAEAAPTPLQTLRRPDPKDLPNNHLAYAGQWFFFALTSLVIYWLAVRRLPAARRSR